MLQLYKASSKVSRRSTFWNREYFPSFLIETLLALIHPNIFCKDIYFTTNKSYYLEEIKYEVKARRPGDPAILIANSNKAFRKLNWMPTHSSLEEILIDALRWRQNRKY